MPRALARRFHENSVGETDDWFTPREIFDALGLTFDLDPAHPGVGTPHCCVPALKVYTRADDGLAQPWFGLVFINPPFGVRNAHLPWMRKFFAHGNGIMIVRAYTSSAWWHEEMSKAELILFPRGKTKFVRPDGSIGTAPGHGVVLVSMGTVACDALQASGLGMLWDQRAEHQHRFEASREKSPIIMKETVMATRKEVEKTETPEESDDGAPMTELDAIADHSGLSRLKTELKSTATKLAPITVGNPASAASLAIDQSHLEEFAIAEDKSPDVRYGKPPKGAYFTVLPETGTTVAEWKNRAFYYLLEIEGRDPLIVAPDIAKQKIAEGEDVIRPILIVRYVTMAGEEGLWPLKIDKPNTKSNRFNKSALEILAAAEKGWVRLFTAKDHYWYQPSPKTLEQKPPQFSDRSFQGLIDLQFKDQVVNSLDHEIWNILDQGSDK